MWLLKQKCNGLVILISSLSVDKYFTHSLCTFMKYFQHSMRNFVLLGSHIILHLFYYADMPIATCITVIPVL